MEDHIRGLFILQERGQFYILYSQFMADTQFNMFLFFVLQYKKLEVYMCTKKEAILPKA